MLLSKPFLTSLWYLNTTDRIFSTFYHCLQFSFNVWSPGKALWKTHSRCIKYGGVWGESHFSCMPSLKAAEWGPTGTQIWSLGWSWHYKPELCQATFYNHSAFFLCESADSSKCSVQAVPIYQAQGWEVLIQGMSWIHCSLNSKFGPHTALWNSFHGPVSQSDW